MIEQIQEILRSDTPLEIVIPSFVEREVNFPLKLSEHGKVIVVKSSRRDAEYISNLHKELQPSLSYVSSSLAAKMMKSQPSCNFLIFADYWMGRAEFDLLYGLYFNGLTCKLVIASPSPCPFFYLGGERMRSIPQKIQKPKVDVVTLKGMRDVMREYDKKGIKIKFDVINSKSKFANAKVETRPDVLVDVYVSYDSEVVVKENIQNDERWKMYPYKSEYTIECEKTFVKDGGIYVLLPGGREEEEGEEGGKRRLYSREIDSINPLRILLPISNTLGVSLLDLGSIFQLSQEKWEKMVGASSLSGFSKPNGTITSLGKKASTYPHLSPLLTRFLIELLEVENFYPFQPILLCSIMEVYSPHSIFDKPPHTFFNEIKEIIARTKSLRADDKVKDGRIRRVLMITNQIIQQLVDKGVAVSFGSNFNSDEFIENVNRFAPLFFGGRMFPFPREGRRKLVEGGIDIAIEAPTLVRGDLGGVVAAARVKTVRRDENDSW